MYITLLIGADIICMLFLQVSRKFMYPPLTQKSVLTNTIIDHLSYRFYVRRSNKHDTTSLEKDDTDERIYMHEFFGPDGRLLGDCIKSKQNVFPLLSSLDIYLEGIVSF